MPPLRTKSVGTKVSEEEFAMLEARAETAGRTLSEWVRDVLLAAPTTEGELIGEVALAELLALRTLLLNLFFRAAKGEAIPEPEMAGGAPWVLEILMDPQLRVAQVLAMLINHNTGCPRACPEPAEGSRF
ncbi:MAG: plasmid mobilization protein [Terracidiphilus sp.]